ncbi:hypothetical protein [Microvirga zambiensis]|uniref:hypothetical protein n=1 Tax=Microvirga zambiensis TaxID=1402137 RepID=UPI00191E30C7|nr:hypothetical protein [Microvirga zambiensis]
MAEEHDFGDRTSATQAAVALLPQDTGLNAHQLSGLIERADIVEKVDRGRGTEPLPGQSPALVGTFRYVIRNDQLGTLSNFLDLLKATTTFAVGLVSLPTPAGIKGVIDGLHGLYSTFKGIIDKGAVLSPQDFAVVAVLRRLKSASPETIAGELKDVDAGTVEALLERNRIQEGNLRGFTRLEENGNWSLVGV